MKKLGLLFAVAVLFTSCLFETEETGVSNWLSDHGMPDSYKLQTLSVNSLKASSVEAFVDTTPKAAESRALLGRTANLSHDLVLDIAFGADTSFIKTFKASDTACAFIDLFWFRPLYTSKNFPSDSLPIKESLDVTVSWKLDLGEGKDFLDSIAKIKDSVWLSSLTSWEDVASADTVFEMSVSKKDTSVILQLPSALVDSLKNMKSAAHLQLRFSAPEAEHLFRFYGQNTIYPPIFALFADSTTFLNPSPTPFRIANIISNQEDCPECSILHGGVFDSLVVEIPSEPVMEALAEYYGDEFPFTKGDGFDVRQTVLLAQLTMPRDDSNGESEFGLPIQVVVGSFVDSGKTVVRRMENYRLNNDLILDSGHPNLIFHEGDSLSVQLTYGVRELLNKANDGRPLKFMMRMGYPFLQVNDTTYADYVTADGDTCYRSFNQFDYARYDFTASLESPMTLKLWLASKRGDE